MSHKPYRAKAPIQAYERRDLSPNLRIIAITNDTTAIIIARRTGYKSKSLLAIVSIIVLKRPKIKAIADLIPAMRFSRDARLVGTLGVVSAKKNGIINSFHKFIYSSTSISILALWRLYRR